MAIVIPIAAPLAWSLTGDIDPAAAETIRFGTLAAVLSGAVFGDHCSPISDTTIMSSLSSACDHVDHVRTQGPYALVCGGVAAFVGFLPAGFGVSPWITLPIGLAILWAIVRYYGKKIE
jgi:Na+/H+ antiporter NhaC